MGKYHLVGIKGTGMAALAISLKQLGNDITGSDVEERFFTSDSLEENLIEVKPFSEENITNEKIYIISAAYDEKNLEVKEIINRKLPYYYYHDFIEKYYHGKKIGISGTHGKTTTTQFCSHLFSDYPLCSIIGDGTGSGNPDYKYLIFEACEYKNHFLAFTYDYLIINNIDFDHPDFFDNLEDVKRSFDKVSKKTKILIVNGDDINANNINHPHKYTFGMNPNCDVYAKIAETTENGYKIIVRIKNQEYKWFIPYLGTHMIYNFLASLTVYYLEGLTMDNIQEKLITLKKPKRRMEEHFYYDNIIIDDYAHHPTEIKACLSAIKLKYPTKKIIVFFEPHTYTRTKALAIEFTNCFTLADELYVAKTFTSKREKYNRDLEKEMRKIFINAKVFHHSLVNKIKDYHNSVIVFMGAGNIRKYIAEIISLKK